MKSQSGSADGHGLKVPEFGQWGPGWLSKPHHSALPLGSVPLVGGINFGPLPNAKDQISPAHLTCQEKPVITAEQAKPVVPAPLTADEAFAKAAEENRRNRMRMEAVEKAVARMVKAIEREGFLLKAKTFNFTNIGLDHVDLTLEFNRSHA